jgi:virulence-associated protein VapD
MARLVAAPNGASVFGKGLFGTLSQNTVNYLQGQIASLANAGSEYGKKVYERSIALFNEINSDAAVMAAEAVLSQIESMKGQDIIERLMTVQQLQAAQPIMQGYIMTDPFIRQAWYDGKIEGYSDTYIDPEPGLIGHEQKAYRDLNNGVFQPHEEASYQYSLYYDRTSESDKVLSIRKLAAIVDSQESAVNAIHAGGQDPTSQYGASL